MIETINKICMDDLTHWRMILSVFNEMSSCFESYHDASRMVSECNMTVMVRVIGRGGWSEQSPGCLLVRGDIGEVVAVVVRMQTALQLIFGHKGGHKWWWFGGVMSQPFAKM